MNQGTVSRWLKGGAAPDKGAVVAAFCRSYDRNPVEGFVAAGMLSESEAGRALSKRERGFLETLREEGATADRIVSDARERVTDESDGPGGAGEGDEGHSAGRSA